MEIQLNRAIFTISAPNVMALVKSQGLDPVFLIVEYHQTVIKQDVRGKLHG